MHTHTHTHDQKDGAYGEASLSKNDTSCITECVVSLFLFSCVQRLTLVHVNSNQCLDKASEEDTQVPSVKDCSGVRSQQWLLRNVTLPEIF